MLTKEMEAYIAETELNNEYIVAFGGLSVVALFFAKSKMRASIFAATLTHTIAKGGEQVGITCGDQGRPVETCGDLRRPIETSGDSGDQHV